MGHSDALTPPWSLRIQVGPFKDPRHYRAVGRNFFGYLIGHCDLRRTEDVLDLGCGCGEVAAPLSGYLAPETRYEGFDVGDELIAWCRRHLAPRHLRFGFQTIDVYSSYYRPDGRIGASEFVFPYGDCSFDFAFAKSLFTHLLPADTANHVEQLGRAGGRAWLSLFLIDERARAHLAAGHSTLDFHDSGNGYWTINRMQPESAIAHPEADVLGLLARHGFVLVAPIERGSWCGRAGGSYQDSILALRS